MVDLESTLKKDHEDLKVRHSSFDIMMSVATVYTSQIQEKLHLIKKIKVEQDKYTFTLFELHFFLPPLVGTIQEHVNKVEVLLTT